MPQREVPQRAAARALAAFSATIVATRTVNYGREQRRPVPAARSFTRRALDAVRPRTRRVHHFLPGMALVLSTAVASVLTRDDQLGLVLAFPLGSGAALTLDELALLLGNSNPYWGSERFAFAQAAVAAVGAAGLHARTRHQT